jgi:hypothetical protein
MPIDTKRLEELAGYTEIEEGRIPPDTMRVLDELNSTIRAFEDTISRKQVKPALKLTNDMFDLVKKLQATFAPKS